jgi:hypothetical protein
LAADEFPEFAQALDAPLGRVAGNHSNVERAYRDAGHPVRLDARLGQAFVHKEADHFVASRQRVVLAELARCDCGNVDS